MSEHLQVLFDVVTREVSYRHTWRERPAVRLLKPLLLKIPASVLCAGDEVRPETSHDVANIGQTPCPMRDVMYLSQMLEVSVCEA